MFTHIYIYHLKHEVGIYYIIIDVRLNIDITHKCSNMYYSSHVKLYMNTKDIRVVFYV